MKISNLEKEYREKIKQLKKRLKNKEQECEGLKNKINYMEGYIRTVENARDEFAQELKRKEQGCEELKQWKKGTENLFKAQTDNPDEINRLTALVSKLQNKLDLIKIEITDNKCTICNRDCDIYDTCLYRRINKILKG